MKDRILILAPHTDDGELGVGATAAKLTTAGNDVFYVAFSWCGDDRLKDEVRQATQIIGIKPENLILFDYQVRNFEYHRQEILDDMILLRDNIHPSIVYMPLLTDVHQDHQTVAGEAIRAFKYGTILAYELPWNNIHFDATAFEIITADHLNLKIQAVRAYQSQSDRHYCSPDFVSSLATVRGVQCGAKYAEAFTVVRWIL